MKLISMTDFVLEVEKGTSLQGSKLKQIVSFAKFLKQPLKLEMFVPCDENGNILEEPVWQVEFEKNKVSDSNLIEKSKQYEQAKEKVLFEGFECVKECDDYLCLTHENITIYYNIEEQIFMLDDNDDTVLAYIECFCNDFNYTYRYTNLTQNAIKQLGL